MRPTIGSIAAMAKKLDVKIGDLVEIEGRRYEVVSDKHGGVALEPAITQAVAEIHAEHGERQLSGKGLAELFAEIPSTTRASHGLASGDRGPRPDRGADQPDRLARGGRAVAPAITRAPRSRMGAGAARERGPRAETPAGVRSGGRGRNEVRRAVQGVRADQGRSAVGASVRLRVLAGPARLGRVPAGCLRRAPSATGHAERVRVAQAPSRPYPDQ
jgi:hypothetical protein